MQRRRTTRTAVMLLTVAMVATGCGARATGSVGSRTGPSPSTATPAATSTTSTTIAQAARAPEAMESTGPAATPTTTTPPTTAPAVSAPPEVTVEDIYSMLDGLDDTLAELDQLLNQATASLAVEEGVIIP